MARGEDSDGSDLDLRVSFDPGTTIFEVAGLIGDLEDLLGVRVDVVGDAGGGRTLGRAHAEAVPI